MARPREFDTDEVLNGAMAVFWEKGYEGTSMRDLLTATGLNKQSLYGAFGNKQQIYLAALRNYEDTHMRRSMELLKGAGDPKERVGQLLQTVVDAACKRSDRRGCLLCNAAVDRSALEKPTRAAVLRCIGRLEKAIATTLGETEPYDRDQALRRKRARSLVAAYFGLNVLAKAGASRSTLEDARDAALQSI